jgi:aminoglycoside phosphotransferase (APT) family kinase protein
MLEPSLADPIVDRYGLGAALSLEGPVARGEIGEIWRLQTDAGAYAVKESFEPITEVEVREDAAYQEAIHAAGISVPAVVRAVDGSVLVDLDVATVRVFGWVDLLEVDRGLDPVDVGRTIAAIHRVPFAGRQPVDPWYTDPVGADGWDRLINALQGAKAPFAERIAAYRDELVALEALLEAPDRLQTSHRDLWADNVRGTAEGSICVIDWESCGLADPGQELAMVLVDFGSGLDGRAASLYRAYRGSGGPGRIDRRGHFTSVIAQLGHIGERHCRRWLDPATSQDERRHHEAGVAEFTDLALTRETIDALLDEIRGTDDGLV